ncbi:MAG: hypothetical protein ACI8TQ_001268 [Planctomycetota bacterium]
MISFSAMRIAVTGSSGLVGASLVPALEMAGHEVVKLVRREPRSSDELTWDPLAPEMPPETKNALQGVQAAIHLAGANIADARWSARRKQIIESSRTRGTDLLARTLAELDSKPSVLVCASAVGIYGNRGADWVDASSLPGSGFLAGLCQRWESAANPARTAGIRVAHMRLGVVFHPTQGALAKMTLPFRLGLGAPLGKGAQFMSWIGVADAVGAILHVLENENCIGPIDTVAPHPVTNIEFTTALAGVFRRKARLRIPKIAARLLFGELAEELLLAGQRVRPTALLRSGYAFQQPEIVECLRGILNRPKRDWFEELGEATD